MTKDQVIQMAREAGFNACNGFSQLIVRHSNGSWVDVADQLERFAALVAAAEREACATVCDHEFSQWIDKTDDGAVAVKNCATAIRARKDQT